MLLMRPARAEDLPEVRRLAAASPIGVTSLADDDERLREKIATSEASLAAEVGFAGEESYFFVLEDVGSGRLVGCSGITASAGYSAPFYSFRNETFVHAARELKIHNKIHVLSLCHDLTGETLLTSFHIDEGVSAEAAELISRGRLLFIADHPQRFADAVVVEIVGLCDERGVSPFWEAVGRNFFAMDYAEAERICGLKSRTFLAELMPHYPIYVPLLPDEAQDAMGEVHARAQTSFDILMREGFETDRYIDIFDGGPTLHAKTHNIRTISASRRLTVRLGGAPGEGEPHLVANGRLDDYRALLLPLPAPDEGSVMLDADAAALLGVAEGDELRVIAL